MTVVSQHNDKTVKPDLPGHFGETNYSRQIGERGKSGHDLNQFADKAYFLGRELGLVNRGTR